MMLSSYSNGTSQKEAVTSFGIKVTIITLITKCKYYKFRKMANVSK
jgi:hypothetical protein